MGRLVTIFHYAVYIEKMNNNSGEYNIWLELIVVAQINLFWTLLEVFCCADHLCIIYKKACSYILLSFHTYLTMKRSVHKSLCQPALINK